MLHDRYILNLHFLDPDIGAPLDSKNDLVDPGLFSLNFHGYRPVPFISYPARAAVKLCCVTGPVPEADSLHMAIKYDVLPHDAAVFHG